MGLTMAMTIRTGVAILLLLGVTVGAHAAGLGRLTVNSALGQTLDAEIELVSVQPGELDTLTARVAPPEAYRDARIEYSNLLRTLRFSVDKRPNGQPYIKITSIAPINEPFMDVLIEMTWPAGRIQREYPILLDPPGFSAKMAPRAAPPPVAAAPTPPPAVAPAASPSQPATTASTAPATTGSPSARVEMGSARTSTPPPATAAGETYGPVQKGETLRKIAGEVKPSNVSMEQMLVALYRENQGAFVDSNMNRLKAGQILKVPSADDTAKIADREANREIRTHVTNWKAYREQLAGGVASLPARPEAGSTATGRVATAAVPPPAPASSEGKDVLKLSKSDAGKSSATGKGGGGADRANALQEELIAKDKALKESQSRVAELEKQIRDMQRLLDLKGAPAKVDPKAPVKPADTKVAEAPKPAEPAKVDAKKPAEAVKPAEAPKTAEVKPAEPAKSAEPAKPAEPVKPAEAPKVAEAPKPTPPKTDPKTAAKKPPPPPPSTSIMDDLPDAWVLAAGLGALGALALGGFLFVKRRKSRSDFGPSSSMTSAFPSDLKPDMAGGRPGGGLVDTGNSSFLTDFDKTGPGTIDTDEVDPVAEAEVYIAYGRDAQAEEILKEAMARDKSRHEIALKLLEIYHARKSATAFETVAKELHASVGDSSPLWTKAAAMGAQIDPTNPLYVAAASGTATFTAMSPAAAAPKPDLDFDLDSSSSSSSAHAPAPSFDLDLDSQKSTDSHSSLDIDLAPSAASGMDVSLDEPKKEEKPSFDFDLSGLDFPGKGGEPEKTIAPAGNASMDLSDLDLGSGGSSGGGDAVGTKLELAKAYLEIGDKDGAREILDEVVKEGSAAQKSEAQSLIATL